MSPSYESDCGNILIHFQISNLIKSRNYDYLLLKIIMNHLSKNVICLEFVTDNVCGNSGQLQLKTSYFCIFSQ